MLHGQTNFTEATIQRSMLGCEHTFYLTGSRFFGGWKSNSDWDFFAQYSPEICKWLIDNRFTLLCDPRTKYNDDECVKVYRYQKFGQSPSIPTFQIDVQLVKDAGLKLQIQNMMKSHFQFMHLYNNTCKDKVTRSILWNALYSAVKNPENNHYNAKSDTQMLLDYKAFLKGF